MRYAIVKNGIVENVILWDGVSDWTPPAGPTLVSDSDAKAKIGGTWNGTVFA